MPRGHEVACIVKFIGGVKFIEFRRAVAVHNFAVGREFWCTTP